LQEEIVLKVKDINKQFPGTKALTNMSFDLRRGEALGLVGENGAGKSTLMNIISGVLQADSGLIELFGKEIRPISPKDAQNAGIGFVHQELTNCTHLSVAENVFMGRLDIFRNRIGFINYKKLNAETQRYLDMFKSRIKPEQKMRELKVADQQIIEIIKSLSLDCKILIFDEPTSSLTEVETETLFRLIKELKAQGISILYISHRMVEVFKLCERITVIRDGFFVDTLDTDKTNFEEIVNKMVGRIITNFYPPKSERVGDVIFEVKGLTYKGLFKDVSFNLREGEILGLSGLVGAGRTEVACSICGIFKLDEGEIYLKNKKVRINTFSEAIRNGITYLTEDRKLQGLFLQMSIKKNITATNLKKVTTGLAINDKLESQYAAEFTKKLNIKIANVEQKVNSLSGGNQQKVMIAKWLYTNPKVLIMDEPTRGIDVGAKSEIHNMLRDLANQGMAIIVISSELPEIIGLCDRVLVMHDGKVTGELSKAELCEERIIALATAI
jgi:ribose transport system ATP-binding protein